MKLFLLAAVLFTINTQASEFTHLRNDTTIPEQCKTSEASDFFADDLEYFTYSRSSDRANRFDYKVDISRGDVRTLWGFFRGGQANSKKAKSWADSSEDRMLYYNMINDNYKAMDFDFSEEGQILEIIVVAMIKAELSDDMYVTGSVAYSGSKSRNRIGELDIVVGYKETCKVEYVGEVKVNPRRLGHARSQLGRFKNFIESEKRN